MTRLACFAFLLSACAYQSEYAAPRDGRARAVWAGSDVVVELSGAPLGLACAEQLRAGSASSRLRLSTGEIDGPVADRFFTVPHLAFWVPIYWGSPVYVVGAPPVWPAPVFFLPPPVLAVSGTRSSPSSNGPSGAGVAAGAAIFALVAVPIVDVLLAALPTEGERSSDAIDQVNVFNDLARTMGSPCAYGAPR